MLIDKTTYVAKFGTKKTNKKKKRIVLLDSYRKDDNYLKYNNKLTKKHNVIWTNYTVNRNGDVFQHMDDNYYGYSLEDNDINETSITISLSNGNFLNKEDNIYLNWLNEFIDEKNVGERKFNGYVYWEKYYEKQYVSLSKLLKIIIKNNSIENTIVEDNLFRENSIHLKGIFSKSNFYKDGVDVNPLFEFNKIKL